ncbi:uncharacterized protein [Elaeis guineensis]|uniref:Uncharacterized protein LOC105039190 n=1 Tax=Elaeis guineensis var. tenera TaxID=51953 RepID=A0A6I9QQR8_ELAGV|nr:uncharacterized protein LOC105039190 [Elaeis guineensis]
MEAEIHSAPHDEASMADAMLARRCCCFWIPWTSGRSSSAPSSVEWWQRIRASERSDERRPSVEGWWWWRAVMKVREWSELAAGPRWKTFIRRFNRNPRHGGGSVVRMGSSRFQYDPLSYALNFDEGHGGSPDGDYTGYGDFSTRFAVPPAPAKSSVDLAGWRASTPTVFSAAPAGGGGR